MSCLYLARPVPNLESFRVPRLMAKSAEKPTRATLDDLPGVEWPEVVEGEERERHDVGRLTSGVITWTM
jgi:hypothetical protein